MARGSDAIDREVLELIGLIYDAALDPQLWERATQAIVDRHRWHNAGLNVIAAPQNAFVVQVAINIPDNFEMASRHLPDIVALWGGEQRVGELPLEEPILMSDVTDPQTWPSYTYFREWAAPQGLTDQVVLLLARDRMTVANMSFGKHNTMRGIEKAVDELRILAPHVRRAATIGRILENATQRAATFEAALDAASAGAVLVRSDMGIVHANAAGDAMLDSGDAIRATGGRLQPTGELLPGHLEQAVGAAAEGPAALGRRGIGIPMRRRDGAPLLAHVMPLAARGGAPAGADAVVFLAETGGLEPVASQTLELMFGLTPAEARAFELVTQGRSSPEMALAMGVAESTLRTHLLRVYDKTGRHTRAGLVQLANELRLPG